MTSVTGIIEALHDIVGSGHVRLIAGDPAPHIEVFPGNTAEVAEVRRGATACGISVRAAGRGANPGANGPGGTIILTLSRLDRILDISRDRLRARIQPAVTRERLTTAAAALGLMTVSDLRNRFSSPLGDVLGVEAVLPSGQVVHAGRWPDPRPDGHSVTRLLTDRGNAAVITELTLSLHPLAEFRAYGAGRPWTRHLQ